MKKIGETNINSKGERFAILNYRSSTDVDVIFEIDNSVKNVTYQQFKSGHVSRKNTEDGEYWLGEVVEDNNGEECKIVEVNSEDNVTVQYPDGDILTGLSLNSVFEGTFDRKRKDYAPDEHGIAAERKATYENVVYMLNRFRRCVMIRPCGFGKTKIGLKLFFSPRYQKCLFLHPADDDVNSEIIKHSQSKKKIDTKTYAWLRSRTPEQIAKLDYDIVFCDEVHCIGGDDEGNGAYHTYKAVKKLMETHPTTHFVGATATPLRMDGINAIATMFHNHICYPYTEEDAFEDGILKSPYYYYCVYDVIKKIQNEIKVTTNIEMNREELQRTLKFSGEDIDEIDTRYMDKHIRKTCDKVLSDTRYMRFIAFYLDHDGINGIYQNKDKVIGWFKKAYPKHQVESIIVTNRTNKSLKDIDNLPTEPTAPGYEGRIDIIFNCEKLCMSYHSELVTGLILDRKTQSLAKYIQMMGRLLSCDNDNPVIIFDVKDNLHSDFICKTPYVKDEIPIAPAFNVKNATFADVVNANPHARHWDEIRHANTKAKKSEKIMTDAHVLEDNTPVSPVIDDKASLPIYRPEKKDIDDNAKQAIENAWKVVEDKKMTFAEACNYLADIQDEYGTVDPHEDEYEREEEKIYTPYMGLYKTAPVQDTASKAVHIAPAPETKAQSPVSKPESDPLGFTPTYYYDQDTKALYSKNVAVLNKRSNFEEDIKAAIQAVAKSTLDAIIKKWHTYPTCESNYEKYEEVDKKSAKYKFLKSCSEFIYGIPVENTLIYMIEGKVA